MFGDKSGRILSIHILGLPWDIEFCIRGFYRLRAVLLRLRAINGVRSKARFQECISSNRSVRNATNHTAACCTFWAASREAFFLERAAAYHLFTGALCLAVLRCSPGESGFIAAVRFANSNDREASAYWAAHT